MFGIIRKDLENITENIINLTKTQLVLPSHKASFASWTLCEIFIFAHLKKATVEWKQFQTKEMAMTKFLEQPKYETSKTKTLSRGREIMRGKTMLHIFKVKQGLTTHTDSRGIKWSYQEENSKPSPAPQTQIKASSSSHSSSSRVYTQHLVKALDYCDTEPCGC